VTTRHAQPRPSEQTNPLLFRLICSIVALTIAWGIAGVVFTLAVKGPGTFGAWLIWGTAVCLAGWVLVGIPLVAAGDRIYRLPAPVFAVGVGLAGALVMALPFLIGVLTHDFGAAGAIVISVDRTFSGFEAAAFAIAGVSAWLYRELLTRLRAGESGS
jgi:hypothetical protein